MKLREVVAGLEADPDIQVVIFTSELPDFFINHFDAPQPAISPHPNTRAATRSGQTWRCG
jgi:enoyl-CoA hydratase/carnithine racemase